MIEENEISIKSNGGTERMKRGLAERLPAKLLEPFQIICSRVREINKDLIRVYWIHDLPDDPELEHLRNEASRDRFHKFVFCGQWQYNRFQSLLNFPYDGKSTVIETAIDPIEFEPKSFDKIRLIYTSTPQRGLELLVPVFEELAKKYPNIHLDVFSSFKIYGWDEADRGYEPIYDRIRSHPQMTYHGYAPNDVVKDYLRKAHIFAYPSIWMECNSQSLIEAMSAGLLCVHPNFAGLTDTSGGMTMQYQGSSNHQEHANIFYNHMCVAIEAIKLTETQNYLSFVKSYADNRFNWQKVTSNWAALLDGMSKRYPTVESRDIPKPMFTYRTTP